MSGFDSLSRCLHRGALAWCGALVLAMPVAAAEVDLVVEEIEVARDGERRTVIAYNGETPGPTLRFQEGEDVVIRVTNRLDEATSIHWHGLILPYRQDGVPEISFPGIPAGETFTYRFPIVQSGTYWYHSHSGLQEQEGAYGSIVIEPRDDPGAAPYDRDYVVVLSDSHAHSGDEVLANLKQSADYYNRQQRTLGTLLSDVAEKGWAATLSDRADWGDMRMMPTDIADVQGYDLLMNGRTVTQNWTGLFRPGERVRLRFVNAAAMTYFDIRIPGLRMQVVQADGNEVEPVLVDEFRIAVSETYDVIVEPEDDRAYTILAESMARTGFARGTLAPRDGMTAAVPTLREPPLLTMADMGSAHAGMDHAAMGHGAGHGDSKETSGGMDHSKMGHGAGHGSAASSAMPHGAKGASAGMNHAAMGHGAGHGKAAARETVMDGPDTLYAPGSGLSPKAAGSGKFLRYDDLKARRPLYPDRPATREITLRLTGNMERYIWSIDGIKYSDAEPLRLGLGERVRFKFVNETMMTHPMHLHGMWTLIDTGKGQWDPIKHVVSVPPGSTVYTETEVDAPGQWAFHCHLMYHMASGMFRKVVVTEDLAQLAQ